MNLKIAENSFRFRITPKELDALLNGQEIDQRVCLGSHCFAYRVSPFALGQDIELEMAVGGFCLYVPRRDLEDLRDLGRSKGGISSRQGGVELALQVDIKEQMKRAA